ncbi:MAG: PIN domain-containing protein [Candidatus Sumerlaeota bacterium]|nr:PIN domain-containing protein [Candidatus Sumerlaeota bacterium]
MRRVFADTGYWVAVFDPKDGLHDRAMEVSRTLGPCRIVTSEFVLLEMMKLLANAGLHLKTVACEAIRRLKADPNTEVVPATSLLFQQACETYQAFRDKAWDGTDCASYRIMEERNISEALTHDEHFVQMGHRALLRAPM